MKQFLYPYIVSKDTKKQVDYYIETLDAQITQVTYSKDIPNCPVERLHCISHLELDMNQTILYFQDGTTTFSENVHFQLDYPNEELLQLHYQNLLKESDIIKPLGISFWGATYGVLKDPFGVVWHFHYLDQEKQ